MTFNSRAMVKSTDDYERRDEKVAVLLASGKPQPKYEHHQNTSIITTVSNRSTVHVLCSLLPKPAKSRLHLSLQPFLNGAELNTEGDKIGVGNRCRRVKPAVLSVGRELNPTRDVSTSWCIQPVRPRTISSMAAMPVGGAVVNVTSTPRARCHTRSAHRGRQGNVGLRTSACPLREFRVRHTRINDGI